MHNLIITPQKGLIIDHINRKGLDNRRSNLRLVTIRQNYANFPTKAKRYRGVHFHPRLKKTKPYEASIKYDNKLYYLGTYKTAQEAALAYNKEALKAFGECAQLNKI